MYLETERLLLVPLSLEELRRAVESKMQLAEELGYQLFSDELDEKMKQIYETKITKIEKDPEHYLFYTFWQLVLKEERIIIGEVGFKGLTEESGVIEVGFGTEERFRNKGYMTEALSELIKWAFNQKKVAITKITASTLSDNLPSQKVLQKAGLKFSHEEGNMLLWNVEKM
ncbi:MAG: GNAT family N-acetyltransferase [Tissierellales bacterium]|jgi:[ribosomal protein S5]-alanine N-acetyltransferase|nr:GNAT family N-acetyltransferase [Tissierellales bacterium]MBN2827828.1 GNAT family N-acetyltransferase [Tissierellales bacterium]